MNANEGDARGVLTRPKRNGPSGVSVAAMRPTPNERSAEHDGGKSEIGNKDTEDPRNMSIEMTGVETALIQGLVIGTATVPLSVVNLDRRKTSTALRSTRSNFRYQMMHSKHRMVQRMPIQFLSYRGLGPLPSSRWIESLSGIEKKLKLKPRQSLGAPLQQGTRVAGVVRRNARLPLSPYTRRLNSSQRP
jgi:hypothetical protein